MTGSGDSVAFVVGSSLDFVRLTSVLLCVVSFQYDIQGDAGATVLQRLRGHRGRVYAVDCHPDKAIVATGGSDSMSPSQRPHLTAAFIVCIAISLTPFPIRQVMSWSGY